MSNSHIGWRFFRTQVMQLCLWISWPFPICLFASPLRLNSDLRWLHTSLPRTYFQPVRCLIIEMRLKPRLSHHVCLRTVVVRDQLIHLLRSSNWQLSYVELNKHALTGMYLGLRKWCLSSQYSTSNFTLCLLMIAIFSHRAVTSHMDCN